MKLRRFVQPVTEEEQTVLQRTAIESRMDALRVGSSPIALAVQRLQRLARAKGAKLQDILDEAVEQVLMAAAETEQQIAEQEIRIRHLQSLSVTDELTGLLNRRGFRLELERALARAERRQETGLLVLFDLDFFKAVNDSYGHLAGDAVLCAVAELLRQRTRKSDSIARLGGDEFAVLMTDTKPQRGEALAVKLGRLINGLVVKWRDWEIPISASHGIEPYDADSTLETLLFRADHALYRRKREMRNLGSGPARAGKQCPLVLPKSVAKLSSDEVSADNTPG